MASSEHGIGLKEEEGGWLIIEASILASSSISIIKPTVFSKPLAGINLVTMNFASPAVGL